MSDTGIDLCERCGVAEAMVAVADNISDPPRDLHLCQRCWTLTKGGTVISAFLQAGDLQPAELDSEDEELMMMIGTSMEEGFLESMDEKALAEAEAEVDPEGLQALALQLEADAERLGKQLTRVQTRFVRKHIGR